jgi:hypothetical protein
LCALLVLISTKHERLSLDIDLARMIAQRYRLWRHCHSNTRWLGMDGPYSVRLWIRSHTAGTAFRASSFSRPSSTSCACWEWTTPRPRSWPAAFARPCHRRNIPSVPFARTRKSRNRRYRGGLRGLGAADPRSGQPFPSQEWAPRTALRRKLDRESHPIDITPNRFDHGPAVAKSNSGERYLLGRRGSRCFASDSRIIDPRLGML